MTGGARPDAIPFSTKRNKHRDERQEEPFSSALLERIAKARTLLRQGYGKRGIPLHHRRQNEEEAPLDLARRFLLFQCPSRSFSLGSLLGGMRQRAFLC